jgi:hypothetical protein
LVRRAIVLNGAVSKSPTSLGTVRCRDLGSRSSDGYPLITLPDLCGSGARDPARVVRDMWWSRSFFDRDGGLV